MATGKRKAAPEPSRTQPERAARNAPAPAPAPAPARSLPTAARRPPREAQDAYDRDLSHLDKVQKTARGPYDPKEDMLVKKYYLDCNHKHLSLEHKNCVWKAMDNVFHIYGPVTKPTVLDKLRALELVTSKLAQLTIPEVVLPYIPNKAKNWVSKPAFKDGTVLPNFTLNSGDVANKIQEHVRDVYAVLQYEYAQQGLKFNAFTTVRFHWHLWRQFHRDFWYLLYPKSSPEQSYAKGLLYAEEYIHDFKCLMSTKKGCDYPLLIQMKADYRHGKWIYLLENLESKLIESTTPDGKSIIHFPSAIELDMHGKMNKYLDFVG